MVICASCDVAGSDWLGMTSVRVSLIEPLLSSVSNTSCCRASAMVVLKREVGPSSQESYARIVSDHDSRICACEPSAVDRASWLNAVSFLLRLLRCLRCLRCLRTLSPNLSSCCEHAEV